MYHCLLPQSKLYVLSCPGSSNTQVICTALSVLLDTILTFVTLHLFSQVEELRDPTFHREIIRSCIRILYEGRLLHQRPGPLMTSTPHIPRDPLSYPPPPDHHTHPSFQQHVPFLVPPYDQNESLVGGKCNDLISNRDDWRGRDDTIVQNRGWGRRVGCRDVMGGAWDYGTEPFAELWNKAGTGSGKGTVE